MKKRIIRLFTVFIALISFFPLSIYAANAKISVDKISVTSNETVSVNLKLDGTFNANSITETISFDKEKLKVIEITEGDIYNDSSLLLKDYTDVASANNNGKIVVALGGINNTTFKSGIFLTIKFKLRDDIKGELPLALDSKIKNEAGQDLTTSTLASESGSITVIIPVSEVKLDKSSITLNEGESMIVNSTILPEDATNKEIIWTSSNEKVAKVENGKITAISSGNTLITAKIDNIIAKCNVDVKAPIKEIKLSSNLDKISIGDYANVIINFIPNKISEDVKVRFTSSDENIAKVDENGTVLGIKSGRVIIFVKVNDKFEDKIEIEVLDKEKEKPEDYRPIPYTGSSLISIINLNFSSVYLFI